MVFVQPSLYIMSLWTALKTYAENLRLLIIVENVTKLEKKSRVSLAQR